MKLIYYTLCFLTIIMCSIKFADTSPCRKPARYSSKHKTALGRKSNAIDPTPFKTTTLSPKIQKVLNQLAHSKLIQDDSVYASLLKQMKDVFHANPTTVCARCRKS